MEPARIGETFSSDLRDISSAFRSGDTFSLRAIGPQSSKFLPACKQTCRVAHAATHLNERSKHESVRSIRKQPDFRKNIKAVPAKPDGADFQDPESTGAGVMAHSAHPWVTCRVPGHGQGIQLALTGTLPPHYRSALLYQHAFHRDRICDNVKFVVDMKVFAVSGVMILSLP